MSFRRWISGAASPLIPSSDVLISWAPLCTCQSQVRNPPSTFKLEDIRIPNRRLSKIPRQGSRATLRRWPALPAKVATSMVRITRTRRRPWTDFPPDNGEQKGTHLLCQCQRLDSTTTSSLIKSHLLLPASGTSTAKSTANEHVLQAQARPTLLHSTEYLYSYLTLHFTWQSAKVAPKR